MYSHLHVGLLYSSLHVSTASSNNISATTKDKICKQIASKVHQGTYTVIIYQFIITDLF